MSWNGKVKGVGMPFVQTNNIQDVMPKVPSKSTQRAIQRLQLQHQLELVRKVCLSNQPLKPTPPITTSIISSTHLQITQHQPTTSRPEHTQPTQPISQVVAFHRCIILFCQAKLDS